MTQRVSVVADHSFVRAAVAAIVCVCIAGFGWCIASASTAEGRLWKAAAALEHRQFDDAEQIANLVLADNPHNAVAIVIAGDAAAGAHHLERAVDYYKRVPQDGSLAAYRASLGLAVRLHHLGHMREAEEYYRRVLEKTPHLPLANKRLSDLLQVQGRTWEAIEYAMRILRQGQFGATEIHAVACPENRIRHDERYLNLAKNVTPDEANPLLADARIAALENRTEDAAEAYETILSVEPGSPTALFRYGRLLINNDRLPEFRELDHRTRDLGLDHPGVWFNRGVVASRDGQHAGAVKCFAKTLLEWPNHVEVNYAISQSLAALGDRVAADRFGERARVLSRIELLIPEFYDEPTEERMRKLLSDFELLGRFWEAAAMCDFARQLSREHTHPDWAEEALLRLNSTLARQSQVVVTPAPLDLLGDLESYPLPTLEAPSKIAADDSAPASRQPIRFEDVAQEVGLDFQYFNGSLNERGMEHIFETTGGGVGAIDFDRDGYCDIYFSQGSPIWDGDDQVIRRDELFRNRAGKRFERVGLSAGLDDARFGQGVTVGDFDADGFPDLYVGNLGGNRFYRNNGDGTFDDVTEATTTGGDEWTLSCVLADFDGDTLQDLYVVNYLDKEAVFERRCRSNGAPLTCAPTLFPAEQDRVYRNLGDGRFEEVTDSCGVTVAEGKGLAILAADFDQSGRVSVFVGNDTTPNFYFGNESSSVGELKFVETGLVRGLALDGEGRVQATMGIACGDINADGLFDLFVTNFYEDANTAYIQQSPGYFRDATREVNLFEPSFQLLGFGTEFFDADLDGRPDLFLTNGHVDQTEATGVPDRMRPQFFRNEGEQFKELGSDEVGAYLSKKGLGRTVSRLDWNRDGRDDLCVLSLDTPCALLTNTSPGSFQSLCLRLVGTQCDRDAIGTTVRVTTEQGMQTQQLVAGDGYQTCNERSLLFAVDAATVDVEIFWPSGTRDNYLRLPTDRPVTFVEKGGWRAESIRIDSTDQ